MQIRLNINRMYNKFIKVFEKNYLFSKITKMKSEIKLFKFKFYFI